MASSRAVLASTSPRQQRLITTKLGFGGGTVSSREASLPVTLPSTWQAAVTSSSRTLREYALCMTYPASVNSAGTPVMRRFRLTFSKGEPVRYISHLDLMRTWERILRRAGLKLAHSQGFNPRPRLVFAAPLSVGVTSEAEIVDVDLEEELVAEELVSRVRPALPPGIHVLSAHEVPIDARP